MSKKQSSNHEQTGRNASAKARALSQSGESMAAETFAGAVLDETPALTAASPSNLIHHRATKAAQKASIASKISRHQGNRFLTALLGRDRPKALGDSASRRGARALGSSPPGSVELSGTVQRQEGPLGPGPRPEYLEGGDTDSGEQKKEKRYSITLTTGARADLTEADAISLLRDVVYKTNQNVEMGKGEHEILKKTRDESSLVGAGGWLTDLFGEDIPPLSIWEKPELDTARARVAVAMRDVEGAANALIEARASYEDANKKWLAYKNQLEDSGNLATAAVVVVAVVAIAVAVVATPAIAGGAAGGGTTAGGAAAGEAAAGAGAAAEATAAGTTAAGTGTVVVGGGVGGTLATGATLPGVDLVMMLVGRVGAMLASGNTAAATTVLTAYSSTPTGRQTLLKCAQVIVAHMQQPGLTRAEFQMLKQLSETFFLFARGGG